MHDTVNFQFRCSNGMTWLAFGLGVVIKWHNIIDMDFFLWVDFIGRIQKVCLQSRQYPYC